MFECHKTKVYDISNATKKISKLHNYHLTSSKF